MDIIILEFESKANEIDEYFTFIKTTTHLSIEFNEDENLVRVSKTVHNILKANLFLLLYNLIESSFKNALEKVCIQITTDNLKYKDVISEIKKIWIEEKYKNFENCTIPIDIKKSEFIMNKIDDIAEDILKIEFYNDDRNNKSKDISGNLDAREMKKINKKYGIELIDESELDTNSLLIVKNKRNSLAHGDELFSKCGENYTISELEKIKDETIDYMRFILTHIKNFITDKKYTK